jgi:MurNAc alpha-1-phosphate uridylyltransferase
MIKSAMVMAAGLGTRLLPLTKDKPKPMVDFKGKKLIDYTLEILVQMPFEVIVVNTHYQRTSIHAHLQRYYPSVIESFETERLETGGGVKNAMHHFVGDTILIVNPDIIWSRGLNHALDTILAAWAPNKMDCLLGMVQKENFHLNATKGDYDFSMPPYISWIRSRESAAFMQAGVYITKLDPYQHITANIFSNKLLWDMIEHNKRLAGVVIDDHIFDIASPESLEFACKNFEEYHHKSS